MMAEAPGVQLTPEEVEYESRSLAGFDLRPLYGNITCKTLVIAGEYDGINPKELGKEAADAIPGSRYVVISDAGHMIPYEKPEEFTELVKEFFGE